MELVYENKKGGALYVGSDEDYWRAETREFYIATVAKEGPHGHRSMLGYKTPGAPKGPNYLSVQRGRHLAINLIDADDPAYISDEAVETALKFIDKHINEGHKVLVQCNQGHSRGPSIAMLYLRSIGDLPPRFRDGFKIFKTLYPKYDPNIGMEFYAKKKYGEFSTGEQNA